MKDSTDRPGYQDIISLTNLLISNYVHGEMDIKKTPLLHNTPGQVGQHFPLAGFAGIGLGHCGAAHKTSLQSIAA